MGPKKASPGVRTGARFAPTGSELGDRAHARSVQFTVKLLPHSWHFTSLGCPDTYWRLWHPGHTRCGSCTTLQDLGRSLRTSTLALGTRTSTWCTSSTTHSLPWSSTIPYHAPRRRPSFSARLPWLRPHPVSALLH